MTVPAVGEPAVTAPTAAARPPVALYVHIPFCVSLCPYCDFVVYPGAAARGPGSRVGAFVGALLAEIEIRGATAGARWPKRAPLGSVYLGGGTPSLLTGGQLGSILHRVRDSYGVTAEAEVTVEANPGASERGDLEAAVGAGVTRVSFGAQSFDAGELTRLGRHHRPADIAGAVNAARHAGVASLNLDLLYDIPGQTQATWAASLDAALDLAPEHLSLYALTLDDPTGEGLTGPTGDHLPTPAGARRWRNRARGEQDEERAAAQYEYAAHHLASAGYRGYEISNWARPGHESRHNQVYWQRQPYDAVGPGAHGFDGRRRTWNGARLDGYVESLSHGDLPPGDGEDIDESTARAETLILGLRTSVGIAASDADTPEARPGIAWALERGLAERGEDNRIRLSTAGRLLSNEVFVRLI